MAPVIYINILSEFFFNQFNFDKLGITNYAGKSKLHLSPTLVIEL